MAERRHTAFPPAVGPDCRVLILGSLPGRQSLAERRYYAHPSNRFWYLVGPLVDQDLASLPYEDRLTALIRARIGLWDTIGSASRKGSLDADIRDAEHRDLRQFVSRLPDLRAVGFNGARSAKIGRPQLVGSGLALFDLPSSSAAYAAMSLADKAQLWAPLGNFLA